MPRPGLKGPPGHLVIRLSVRLSVCLSNLCLVYPVTLKFDLLLEFFNRGQNFHILVPEETFILHLFIPVRRPFTWYHNFYLDTLTLKFDLFLKSFSLGCYLLMVVAKRALLLLTTILFVVGVGYFVIGLSHISSLFSYRLSVENKDHYF